MDKLTHKSESIDTLRAILALVVVFAHCYSIFLDPVIRVGHASQAISISAALSVLCFFCLSGYVISCSIGSNITRNKIFAPAEYALARIFRIVPPLIVTISIVLGLDTILNAIGANFIAGPLLVRNTFQTDALQQISALFTLGLRGDLAGNGLNGPLWSLKYELQFYTVAGLIASFVHGRSILLKIILLTLTLVYLKQIGIKLHRLPSLDVKLVALASFAFGVVGYKLVNANRFLVKAIWLVLSLLIALVLLIGPRIDFSLGLYTPDLVVLQILISAMFAMFISFISSRDPLISLSHVSKVSYTLYIMHFPLMLFSTFYCTIMLLACLPGGWSSSRLHSFYFLYY